VHPGARNCKGVHFETNHLISKYLLCRVSLHVDAEECTAEDRQLALLVAPVFSLSTFVLESTVGPVVEEASCARLPTMSGMAMLRHLTCRRLE
jgi:hypothetical protein